MSEQPLEFSSEQLNVFVDNYLFRLDMEVDTYDLQSTFAYINRIHGVSSFLKSLGLAVPKSLADRFECAFTVLFEFDPSLAVRFGSVGGFARD